MMKATVIRDTKGGHSDKPTVVLSETGIKERESYRIL